MSCDVYLFRLDQNQFASKVAEMDFQTSFKNYVKPGNWHNLNAAVIIHKATTDIYQLSSDEFWEIVQWINYSHAENPDRGLQFENEKVETILKQFGFYLIEDFQDNTRAFIHASGAFLDDAYDDLSDETRKYHCLKNTEFDLFLDYITYLYTLVSKPLMIMKDLGLIQVD